MVDMYDRFLVSYEKSACMLEKSKSNDAYLDSACYDLNQAFNFLLRHILLVLGEDYASWHDIENLGNFLYLTGFHFDEEECLANLGTIISKWDNNARYGGGVNVTAHFVREVYKVLDSLHLAYLELVKKNTQEE